MHISVLLHVSVQCQAKITYRKALKNCYTALHYALKFNPDLVLQIYQKYIIECHWRLNEYNDVLTNMNHMLDIYLVDKSKYPISAIGWVYDNMAYVYSEKNESTRFGFRQL